MLQNIFEIKKASDVMFKNKKIFLTFAVKIKKCY